MRGGDGNPLSRKMARLEDGYTGSDFERSCAAYDDETDVFAGFANGFDLALSDAEKLVSIVLRRSVGTDHRVGSGDEQGDFIYVAKVVFHGLHICGKADRIARNGGDIVIAREKLGEN